MEYLGNGDLSVYASTGLQEVEIKEITIDVLEGLKAMHKEGFTHRDIKPQVRDSSSSKALLTCSRISSWFKKDRNLGGGG
jgi:hypothetical protein